MGDKPVMLAIGMAALASLLLPGQAFADIAVSLGFSLIVLLPIIIALEVLVFRLTAARLFRIELRFWKLTGAVSLSNIITALLGIPLTFYKDTVENLTVLGVAFVLSVLIEWGVYVPFFRKDHIGGLRLLVISFITNVASYALLIPMTPGVLGSPYAWLPRLPGIIG